MIRSLFQKLIKKTGKNYSVDSRIPEGLIYYTLFSRFFKLSRGFFKLYRKIYVGKNCTFLNKRNIFFGKNVTIENDTIIDGYAAEGVIFGDNVKIGAYSKVTCTSHMSKYGKGLKMGNHSAIGQFTEFGAAGGIEIGNDVIMGSYISFHSENHIFSDNSKLIREQGVVSKGIKIGNNVWVGAKVTFLDGAIIGNNTVIAAGAVVNDVFPNNVVIGGVPAKIIKTID